MAVARPIEAVRTFVDAWLIRKGRARDQLLPLLHALKEKFGYIGDDAVPVVAAGLNLTRADVHGVLTFYHDFKRNPPGRRVVQFCRAESCQSRGSAALEPLLARTLGVLMGETRGDGAVTLEAVYCIGLCAIGPNAMVDGQPRARLDEDAIVQLGREIAA